MFSKILGAAAILALSAATLAQDAVTASADTRTLEESDVLDNLDSERYVRAELDWRSYYLNRVPAQQPPLSWGQVPGEQPLAADQVPLHRTP